MAYDANDFAQEFGVDALRAAWDRAAYRPDVCETRASRRNGEVPSSPPIIERHEPAPVAAHRRFIVMPLPQFQAASFPPRDTVLSPILPTAGSMMLYGQRGLGKTHLATGISRAVATGGEFLRWRAPKPRKVLHIDGEMPGSALQERFALLGEAVENLQVLALDCQPLGVSLNLAHPEHQRALDPSLAGVELVVIDNLSTLVSGGRENDAESWDSMQAWILSLRRRNISTLLIHHAGRGDHARGTSKREDVLDTVVQIKRPDDYEPEDGARFEVHLTKARGVHGDEAGPFEAQIDTRHGRAAWATTDLRDKEADQVLELTADGKSIREIADALGMSKSKVHRLQKHAVDRRDA